MKNLTIGAIFLFGICVGALTMTHELCKQKDSTIRLLMQNTSVAGQETGNLPKNLQVVIPR